MKNVKPFNKFINEEIGDPNWLDKQPVGGSLPTEEQVLQTIFDCVSIRGIELKDYERNFTNEQSGLYDALVKLFNRNDL